MAEREFRTFLVPKTVPRTGQLTVDEIDARLKEAGFSPTGFQSSWSRVRELRTGNVEDHVNYYPRGAGKSGHSDPGLREMYYFKLHCFEGPSTELSEADWSEALIQIKEHMRPHFDIINE